MQQCVAWELVGWGEPWNARWPRVRFEQCRLHAGGSLVRVRKAQGAQEHTQHRSARAHLSNLVSQLEVGGGELGLLTAQRPLAVSTPVGLGDGLRSTWQRGGRGLA